jgi:hypothetical protein
MCGVGFLYSLLLRFGEEVIVAAEGGVGTCESEHGNGGAITNVDGSHRILTQPDCSKSNGGRFDDSIKFGGCRLTRGTSG